jgi:hypothetical protein
MDDITLSCCLKHLIPTTSKVKYCKILAHDELNQITYIKLDSAYIINTAKRSDARATLKHWYVAYITTNAQNMIEMLLFDPYGLNPVESYNFVPKIKYTVVSRYPLQPLDSSKCGLYCLYFIYKRSLGYNSDQILALFSKRFLNRNDKLMQEFYANIGSKLKSLRRHSSLTCCTRLVNKV